jgi:hypothetical protein
MDLSLDKTGEYVITKPQVITYLKISPGLIIDFIYDYNIPIKEGVTFNGL